MIDVRRPGPSDLRWFGVVVLALFGVIGSLLWWRVGASAAIPIWGIGGVLALVYYAIPPLRLPMYLSWMRLVVPIGIAVSYGLLAIIYFGVISPIALLMRAFGRDKLERAVFGDSRSYWSSHETEIEASRYFRQS